VVHTRNAGSLSVPPTSGTVPAIAKDAPVALFCGRLSRLKGTVDLRRIAARVLGSIDHAVIVICGGDGDDGAALRRDLADASAAGRAVFTGFVDEAAKQALFRRAHVVVVPSHEEGWGVTVGDGLAAGCWVVAYDLPAVRDAFPVGPRYVPVGDPETFAQQVLDCLQRPKPASPQAERLDWETIADREMQLILAT
jgi:glycosyltransferase involved in cell wall biosynthesis